MVVLELGLLIAAFAVVPYVSVERFITVFTVVPYVSEIVLEILHRCVYSGCMSWERDRGADLLEKGADTTVESNRGKTALDAALRVTPKSKSSARRAPLKAV